VLLLSPKARRLIDVAVNELTDPTQRANWSAWARQHSRVRTPATPSDEPGDVLPVDAAAAALAALEQRAGKLKDRLGMPSLDEDEQSDIENYLTFIGSVEGVLIRSLDQDTSASGSRAA
jgi:hypothetical protein